MEIEIKERVKPIFQPIELKLVIETRDELEDLAARFEIHYTDVNNNVVEFEANNFNDLKVFSFLKELYDNL